MRYINLRFTYLLTYLPVLEYIIISTIKRTSVGDAAYAMSHGAAVHTAAGCRACRRVSGDGISLQQPSTGVSCGSSGEAASLNTTMHCELSQE